MNCRPDRSPEVNREQLIKFKVLFASTLKTLNVLLNNIIQYILSKKMDKVFKTKYYEPIFKSQRMRDLYLKKKEIDELNRIIHKDKQLKPIPFLSNEIKVRHTKVPSNIVMFFLGASYFANILGHTASPDILFPLPNEYYAPIDSYIVAFDPTKDFRSKYTTAPSYDLDTESKIKFFSGNVSQFKKNIALPSLYFFDSLPYTKLSETFTLKSVLMGTKSKFYPPQHQLVATHLLEKGTLLNTLSGRMWFATTLKSNSITRRAKTRLLTIEPFLWVCYVGQRESIKGEELDLWLFIDARHYGNALRYITYTTDATLANATFVRSTVKDRHCTVANHGYPIKGSDIPFWQLKTFKDVAKDEIVCVRLPNSDRNVAHNIWYKYHPRMTIYTK